MKPPRYGTPSKNSAAGVPASDRPQLAKVEITTRKWAFFLFLIALIAFAAAVSKLFSLPGIENLAFDFVVGALLIVIVAMGMLVLGRLIDPRPALVIDSRGLIDNAIGSRAGRIEWWEIEQVRDDSFRGRRYIVVDTRHPDRFLLRGGSFARRLRRLNTAWLGSPIVFAALNLSIGHDELLRTLKRHHEWQLAGPVQAGGPVGMAATIARYPA